MDSNKSENNRQQKPIIGITLGDINGIGPEIIIKTLNDNRILDMLTPVIFGSTKTLSYYRKSLNIFDFNFSQAKDHENLNSKKINVINCWDDAIEINSGEVSESAGNCSRLALEAVTEALQKKSIDAVVTAPINKSNVFSDQFKFKGHTSFFANKFGNGESLMMMISENLKIGLVTDHIPVKDISAALTKDLIETKIEMFEKTLEKDFGFVKPRIAVMGLNPHAGEEGLLGDEENNIIKPLIIDLKNKGKLIYGPFPSDGFFGNASYKSYDGVLCMYHDQGLIPFKSLSFETGVNYTAGISIVRTSPDHGTANSIAGKNLASEKSFREALFLALEISKKRKEYNSMQ